MVEEIEQAKSAMISSGTTRGLDAKCNGALVESSSALARIIKSFTAFIDYATNPSYRGATLAFNGRQLTSYTKGSNAISYKYDASGLRSSKTVNGNTTIYQYVGDKLYFESRPDGSKHYYFYDSYGNLTHLYYHVGATKTPYNVVTNSQGDVIAIYNWNGNQLVASYSYDAWGNCTITQDTTGIGAINPIRYRGYYYDSEIGLYYLQSRYYDPNTGRFINADGYITTGQGVLSYNMYAYCMNNPVMYSDPSGYYSFEEFLEDAGKTIYKGAVVFDYYVITPIKENIVKPVANSIERHSVTVKTGGVDLGILFGRAETSVTQTIQDEKSGLFYIFDNYLVDSVEGGIGLELGNTYIEVGTSSEGRLFFSIGKNSTHLLPGIHGGISVGKDGIGFTGGVEDKNNLSQDIDVNIGWGSLAFLLIPKSVSESDSAQYRSPARAY